MAKHGPKQKITLRDVAERAAVSHMTVSRVIRGFQNVSPTVHKRVSAAIKALGYRPDPSLSALSAYRRPKPSRTLANCIAFIDGEPTPESKEILRGTVAEAKSLGYSVDCFYPGKDAKKQKHLEHMLFHRGVHGLLFGPSFSPDYLEEWNWHHYAAVCLGAAAPRLDMHAVAIDHFQSSLTACQRLQDRGCRRIAFVVDPGLEERTNHRWLGGYCAALDHGSQKPLCAGPLWNSPSLNEWLQKKKIDGVITAHANSEDNQDAWHVAQRLGINSVLLVDNQLPKTESMSADYYSVGVEGTRILHRSLTKLEYGLPRDPFLAFLPSSLVVRDSAGDKQTIL